MAKKLVLVQLSEYVGDTTRFPSKRLTVEKFPDMRDDEQARKVWVTKEDWVAYEAIVYARSIEVETKAEQRTPAEHVPIAARVPTPSAAREGVVP